MQRALAMLASSATAAPGRLGQHVANSSECAVSAVKLRPAREPVTSIQWFSSSARTCRSFCEHGAHFLLLHLPKDA